MKRILITGANSYIGTSFANYINTNFSSNCSVDTIDMVHETWFEKSFSGYDCVFHVAGIAHQKETKENAHLYYEVNRDLAVKAAQKAKADGVKQFVFLSSMSVYGRNSGIITKETKPDPVSHYGRSKWEAEQALMSLREDSFLVCIIRPPMVYGKGCKGNFNTIVNIIRKSPIFPDLHNKRSMIYIDNLSSFVELCIRRELSGVYFPQNREYVSTSAMAREIAAVLKKRIIFDRLSGCLLRLFRLFLPVAEKAFGTLIYQDTEEFGFSYIVTENRESFRLSLI